MSSQLKISADTSEVKKSILDLSKNLKDIGKSKVALFSQEDKKFIKTELKKEMALMKSRLQENRAEIKKMIAEQKKLTEGSKEELDVRKKILDAYKTQNKLGKELGEVTKVSKGGFGGGGGGGLFDKMMNVVGMLPKVMGGLALAAGGFAVMKGIQASDQYVAGSGNRVRLKGLGVHEDNFGTPETLARAGLSEQDLIKRRIDATSVLGRQGTSNDSEMQKASFERAYGLQGGSMTNVAAGLRPSMGGQGANEAQMKLQASIMASGLEDAIGPYLETMSNLLSSINETGMTSTGELTNIMAQLTKEGGRTPEQMSKTFGGINSAIQGASGQQSAFLQTAFARGGIGGGTIGGTKYAMESGGLFGMNQNELQKRGYNKELLGNMSGAGMFKGLGGRTDALLNQFKASAGMKPEEKISGITDMNKMVGMSNLSNNVFGTKGNQGFDALMMLEKVQNKQMTAKDFEEQVKKMQESKDPQVERLDKINSSLAGHTEILTHINENLMENLGKNTVGMRNELKDMENTGIQGTNNVAGAVNNSGVVQKVGGAVNKAGKYMMGGGLGESVYNGVDWLTKKMYGDEDGGSDEQIEEYRKKIRAQRDAYSGAGGDGGSSFPTAKDIGTEVAAALKNAPLNASVNNKLSIKSQGMTSKPTERTRK